MELHQDFFHLSSGYFFRKADYVPIGQIVQVYVQSILSNQVAPSPHPPKLDLFFMYSQNPRTGIFLFLFSSENQEKFEMGKEFVHLRRN